MADTEWTCGAYWSQLTDGKDTGSCREYRSPGKNDGKEPVLAAIYKATTSANGLKSAMYAWNTILGECLKPGDGSPRIKNYRPIYQNSEYKNKGEKAYSFTMFDLFIVGKKKGTADNGKDICKSIREALKEALNRQIPDLANAESLTLARYQALLTEILNDESFINSQKSLDREHLENLVNVGEEIIKGLSILPPPTETAQGPRKAPLGLDELLQILQQQRQIILCGPPGTGKTWTAQKLAAKLQVDSKSVKLVQFHPGYSYADFVEGIAPDGKGFSPTARIFREIAEQAKTQTCVLIIDEINRARVADTFGELLYGLEKRGEAISTALSKTLGELSVPENLYIIGTMNTADRTLSNLDYALRRRFAFVPVLAPEPECVPPSKAQKLYAQVYIDVNRWCARGVRPEDIMPGPAYFALFRDGENDSNQNDLDYLRFKLRYQLWPLLQEYAKNGLFSRRSRVQVHSGNDGAGTEVWIADPKYLKKLEELLQ